MRAGTRMTCGRARPLAFSMAAAAGAGFMAFGATSVANAVPIPAGASLYDTFTVGDGTGTAGTALDPGDLTNDGTPLEGGTGTWETASADASHDGWEYGASGNAVVQVASGAPTILTNDLPDITGQVVTVQADLQSVSNSYEMLALSSVTNLFTGNDALTIRFFPNGNYEMRANNDGGNKLVTGTIADYATAHPFVNFAMTYDQANQTASLSVDGTSVLSNYDLAGNGFAMDQLTGAGLFAGFRSQVPSAAGVNLVDNFAVTLGPIPEPGTLALIGLGGLALLGRKRRQVQ